jgi:uncharacterized membrane protein
MRILGSFAFIFVILLVIIAVAYWFHYAPQLPDKIPTHFDHHGRANAWASPAAFARLYWGVILGLFGISSALALALQSLPSRFINLPRRDYWFSPSRQARTRYEFAERLLGLCAVTLVFFLLLFHLSVRSALDGSGVLGDDFNWILGGYLGFVAIWTGWVLYHYSHPPSF